MFNSDEYGFIDLTVVMLGRPVVGLRGIRYNESQEKGNVHGAGKKPIARTRGQVNFEGELRILHSELRAILQSQGSGKSILSIRPFDIVCTYAPEAGGVISTDTLKYVEFTQAEIDLSNGDQFTEVVLPIIIGDIKFNV
jgi:hypothetical protein